MDVGLTEITAILTALGVGGALPTLAKGAISHYTGRAEKERATIRSVTRDHDAEATYRRLVAEHASQVRRIAIDHGVPVEQLPPWPTRPDHRTD